MRYCKYGDHEIAEEEFAWKNKEKGIRNSICKPCNNERTKKWYSESPTAQANAMSRNKKIAERNAVFVWNFKSNHPCVDCGEAYPLFLEFDHVHGKTASIARLVSTGASIERIQNEIGKCEVVCVKCHRVRTAHRAGWKNLSRLPLSLGISTLAKVIGE